MASSGNGNEPKDLNKQLQKRLEESKQDMLLFERFKRIAVLKLEAMTRQSEESGVVYQMGDKEMQAFRQLQGAGLYEGMAAGLVAFFTLRRGPIYFARWLHKRKLAQQYQHHQHHTPSPSPPQGDGSYQLSNPNMTNPFDKAGSDFPRSRNVVIRGIWFVFDSVLSLMLAASVSMAYTDTDQVREQIIGLPLLPGRSLTSDALCDDIVLELQKLQKENNPAYARLSRASQQGGGSGGGEIRSPASFYLEGIMRFAENCQRRRFVEQRERQERGLSKDDPVEVTEPIPRDGPRLILDIDAYSNDNNNAALQQEFQDEVSSDFNDFDWMDADDFTSDYEDQQQQKRQNRPDNN